MAEKKCELNLENLVKYNRFIEEGDSSEAAIQRLKDELFEEKRSELLQAVVNRARELDVDNYVKEYSGGKKSDEVLRQEGWYFSYAEDPSGRFKGQNLFDLSDAMGSRYTAPLEDFFRAARKTFTKNSKDSVSLEDLFREADGIDTGNKLAKDALAIWRKQTELARQEGNALGSNIGKIEDWFPQTWNGHLMRKMGFDKFLKTIEGKVDLEKSFPAATPEERAYHIRVWFNQAAGITERLEKPKGLTIKDQRRIERVGQGRKPYDEDRIFANKFDHVHREIHFNNKVDQWEVTKVLGNYQDDGVTAMISSLENMGRRNATLKLHGTDPQGAFDLRVAEGVIDPKFRPKLTAGWFSGTTEGAFKVTTGLDNANASSNVRTALGFKLAKDSILLAKLGKVILTALPSDFLSSISRSILTDTGFSKILKAKFQKLPKNVISRIRHNTEMLSEASNAGARQGDAADVNVHLTRSTGRLLRAQGLSHATQWAKDSVAQGISADLAEVAGKSFDELSKGKRFMLEGAGINAKDWDIIRKSGVEDYDGVKYIFTDRLPVETQDKMLGMFAREADAHTPTARGSARAITTRGATQGTPERGIYDLAYQFKGTPFHEYLNVAGGLKSNLDLSTKGKYIAARLIGGYLAGFAILNASNIAQGKGFIDITEMDAKEHALLFVRCITKAGTIGIVGDAVLESAFGDGYGQDLIKAMTPPALGIVSQGLEKTFTSKSPGEYFSNLANFGIDNLPGQNFVAFQAIIDRLLQDNIREILDPKAKKKARQQIKRLKKQDKSEYWWKPGSTTL